MPPPTYWLNENVTFTPNDPQPIDVTGLTYLYGKPSYAPRVPRAPKAASKTWRYAARAHKRRPGGSWQEVARDER